MDDLTVRLTEPLNCYAFAFDCDVEIKQECVEILPEDIKSLKTEIDLGILVKSENQSCADCENTRDNLRSEKEQSSKKPRSVEAVQRSETLECDHNCGVEENLVNNIDYDHEIPRHVVPLKRKGDCEVDVLKNYKNVKINVNTFLGATNPLAKERETRENTLGKKIVVQQKLPHKSKDQLKGTLQNGVELKPTVKNIGTNKTTIQKTLDNRQEFTIHLKLLKCHYCDFRTMRIPYLERHILTDHREKKAMIYGHNLFKRLDLFNF